MATIEFPESARLVFLMGDRRLTVNPRTCKGDKAGKVWPYCENRNAHVCKEHSADGHTVSLNHLIDNQYGGADAASPWFAFWQEDCMSPPIWIVRAESFEAAYEEFLDELPETKLEDLDEDQRAMVQSDGNGPDGYTYAANGLVYSENVSGVEIRLVEVTCE